jgi:hypothetical protein
MLGLELLIWLMYPAISIMFAKASHVRVPYLSDMIDTDVSFVLWATLAAAVIVFRGVNRDFREGRWALVLTGLFGISTAVFIALAFANAGPVIAKATGVVDPLPFPYHHAITNAVTGGVVVLYAIAGALRYRMEKLNVEAEALDYRDALRRFERAERRLADGSNPASGAPADEDAGRRIVLELGHLALAENESWLKSRRERPLTPIVG